MTELRPGFDAEASRALATVRWPDSPTGWISFSQPREIVGAARSADVKGLLDRVEAASRDGHWAVGFVTYEAAPAFDPSLTTQPPGRGVPLAWFAIFDEPVPARLGDLGPASQGPSEWRAELDRGAYLERVRKVRQWIERGNTYQANLTYRLRGRIPDPRGLFVSLCQTQPVDHACLLETEDWALCSASPELFFDLSDQEIVCRPMKGTRSRGRFSREDEARANELRTSEKDRAENLMIVDMVRNDLGRVSLPGTVQVESLFELEKYATVWQMVSQVRARTEAGLAEIFGGLFPPASITGAPKARTMELLAELEPSPRGIYTGTVGVAAPRRRWRFNVAIRTVFVQRTTEEAEYGVGGGIVWDSVPDEELTESRSKAVALAKPRPPFSLLETLRWEPGEGFTLQARHLERMADSAGYFGFPFDIARARELLEDEVSRLPPRAQRVRLLLSRKGELTLEAADLSGPSVPWRVALAARPIDPADPFLFHKTTHRAVYDRARKDRPDVDDVLLWNPQRELTESTIANLALRRGDIWVTPPIECGLLAGTLRAELVERGDLVVDRIHLEELTPEAELQLVNSVRGRVAARLWDET